MVAQAAFIFIVRNLFRKVGLMVAMADVVAT